MHQLGAVHNQAGKLHHEPLHNGKVGLNVKIKTQQLKSRVGKEKNKKKGQLQQGLGRGMLMLTQSHHGETKGRERGA